MRLFLGIEVPDDIKFSIYSSLEPIRSTAKGWENPADYHLTLLFIGEVTSAVCDEIQQRMMNIEVRPFELTYEELRFFNRRVLYLSFTPSQELTHLKDQVENAFSEYLTPHRKPFISHLTIKRWQRYEYKELHDGIEKHPLEKKTFKVKRLALFKSEKDEFNQKYHVIKTHPE